MGHRKFALAVAAAALLVSGAVYAQDAPPPADHAPGMMGPGMMGPGMMGPGMMGRGMMDQGMGRGMEPRIHIREMRRGMRGHMEPGKHIEGRIAFLKAELKITDKQGKAWDQYAAFLRDEAKARASAMEDMRAKAKPAPREGAGRGPSPGAGPGQPPGHNHEMAGRPERKPVLERLGDQETRLKTVLDHVQKRKVATEALFKILSDEQKKLAEDLL